MSYPTHLIKINNSFYYKIKVPVDLQQYFQCTFIKKSLRTAKLCEAKVLLTSMEYNTHKGFTMLRTGMLTDELVSYVVNDLVPPKNKKSSMGGKQGRADRYSLPEVIKRYEAARQVEWTEKTRMEVTSVFKLLLNILGAIDVRTITKATVLELRSTLQKLPANLYKKYPGKSIKQVLAIADIDPMSTKSVNKHVARLGAVLRYCVDDEGIMTNMGL